MKEYQVTLREMSKAASDSISYRQNRILVGIAERLEAIAEALNKLNENTEAGPKARGMMGPG